MPQASQHQCEDEEVERPQPEEPADPEFDEVVPTLHGRRDDESAAEEEEEDPELTQSDSVVGPAQQPHPLELTDVLHRHDQSCDAAKCVQELEPALAGHH